MALGLEQTEYYSSVDKRSAMSSPDMDQGKLLFARLIFGGVE
jgi:hypothetical protein